MSTGVVLFTRDLRVHDHAALSAAVERHECVVPLFVLDDALLRDAGTPNRVSFLLDALADLRDSLRTRGGDLVVRRGDVVAETQRTAECVGATTLYIGDDVSLYARERLRRLREQLDVHTENTTAVVPPGELVPDGRDHYRVFTPYWRRWQDEPLQPVLAAPTRLRLSAFVDPGRLPSRAELVRGAPSPGLPRGGEREGRARLDRWIADGVHEYDAARDDLAADRTSRLSPFLHFGCVSANETAARARSATQFVRQLCWRDFYAQLLAANPDTPSEDLHPARREWVDDSEALERWRTGQTGVPIVDAAMRQLHVEGWMHNRARLVVAAFLTKTLRLDWRHGARVFAELLVDADVANNVGNWQWVAGTGVDTRPNRLFNPLAQAKRRDPNGDYVRRYVPELADIAGATVHEPWRAPLTSVAPEYPPPLSRVA